MPPAKPQFNNNAVLLVEDNPTNQFAVNQLLEPAGINLDFAGDGQAALDSLARREDFDLVLMDVEMPGMNGIDATREIRRRWPDRKLPIVALTGNTEPAELHLCREAGMTEVLTKPIRRKTLLAALHKWLPGKPDLEESAIQANVVAPSAAVELPQVHGVNVAEAVARLGLPWIMLKAILGKLATALPERLAEVRRALDANDLEEARRHAHSIAGAAGSAGAMKVHVRAKTLEKAVKDDQPANLEKLFSALSEELDIIVFSIGKLD